MAVPLDEFVKRLEESGVISGDTIKDFIPPKASPKGSEELALELVKKKKLTKYQAAVVYSGNSQSLVLGNYILLEKIGSGGMGQVFKARHQRMDRIVAIKLLSPTTSKDPDAIARFEREVRAAAKLTHPNIVAAHDADCADGFHFLVMEYVDGNDLSAVIKKNGPIAIERAMGYILQAAYGLEAAHKKGVVHRDIKPSNLLLDAEGTIKILDMGLAILQFEDEDSDVPQDDLTTVGKIMGTVDFMSPEQALNTHTADGRTDIYALGCSLYYLLTGKAMYTGNSPMEKLMAHRLRPIPTLASSRPETPPQVEAIFKKMVAKKVVDRFQSSTELISALKEYIGQQSPSTDGSKATTSSINDDFPAFDLSDLSAEDVVESDLKLSGSSKNFKKSPSGKSLSSKDQKSKDQKSSPSGKTLSNKTISGSRKSTKSLSTKVQKSTPANNGTPWLLTVIAGCVFAVFVLSISFVVLRLNSSVANSGQNTDTQVLDDSTNSSTQKSKPQRVGSSKTIDVGGKKPKVFDTTE